MNFLVVPTERGPKLVQKGVTVKPGILDNLFAQLKYQNMPRPSSTRHKNDSFISSQSWEGAAHFKHTSIRVGAHGGDRAGLGVHYNPAKNMKRHGRSITREEYSGVHHHTHSSASDTDEMDEH